MLEQTDKQRLEIQAVILERLADLVQVNPQAAAISLANTSLALLAKTFPTLLTAQDQQHIQQNIPGVTPERMAEHAMSPEGTRLALALANRLARTAMDYSPLSSSADSVAQDAAAPADVRHRAASAINHGFQQALAEGISPLGAVSMTIRAAVTRAAEFDLHPFQVVRALLEGVTMTLQRLAQRTEREGAEVTALAQQMGISRSQAREHLRQTRGR